MKDYVISDIDGTITKTRHWKADVFATDGVREDVREYLWGRYDEGYGIIFLTGRWEKRRQETERWLHDNDFPPYDLLLMAEGKENDADFDYDEYYYDKMCRIEETISKYCTGTIFIEDSPAIVKYVRDSFLAICMSKIILVTENEMRMVL